MCLLSACAQLPQQPTTPTVPEVQTQSVANEVALSWEVKDPSRKSWSKKIISLLDEGFETFDKVQDMNQFCPKYASLSKTQKLKTWGELWVAVAYFESGYKPTSASVDVGTKTNKDTWSVGLYQMSVVDQKNYKLNFGYTYDDLLKPEPNITLALAILKRQIEKRGLIVVPSNPYWAVIYNGKYPKITEIKARIKPQLSFCF